MPHDAVTLREDVMEKSWQGDHDSIMRTQYIAPATADGGIGEDIWKEFDIWAAGEVQRELKKHYPGYDFRVIHDSFQGVCLISLPILMGVNRFMAVNLKTHALDSERVMKAGGEILERYGLRRGRFQLAPFLEARAEHSALVMPSRKVPE